jgi:RNA polymerase sigma factor (TIGR02999 family)
MENVDITDLLAQASAGDSLAWDHLVARVYRDLRRLARRQSSQCWQPTLGTSSLVHEWYLRIAGSSALPQDRKHFFALAARVMRQVIIDHARERLAAKRGSGARPTSLEQVSDEEFAQARDFVAVDEALTVLAGINERQARVVEARFFAGLTEQETADAVGVSLRLVQRDWHEARQWLEHFLEHDATL